jgi:hypothetical protein
MTINHNEIAAYDALFGGEEEAILAALESKAELRSEQNGRVAETTGYDDEELDWDEEQWEQAREMEDFIDGLFKRATEH